MLAKGVGPKVAGYEVILHAADLAKSMDFF